MYTIVYENGKRVNFSNSDCLLLYLLHFSEMQLRDFVSIFEWLDYEDDLPFCWESFNIIKE